MLVPSRAPRLYPTLLILFSILLGVPATAATSYDQSDAIGTWRLYEYWDGDFNDPGWTRSVVTVDESGDATGTEADSDGLSSLYSGSVTVSGSGAITIAGPESVGLTSSRYQLDSGKTVVVGVTTEIDNFGNYRNLEVGLKQGSGFTTGSLSGLWLIYLYGDNQTFNEPGWTRFAVTFDGSGTITSGSFTDSEGLSGPVAGSATVTADGKISLLGGWAEAVTFDDIYLDADGTVLAGVLNDDEQYINFIIGVRLQGSYQAADLTGDWDLFTFFDNTVDNEAGTSRGPLLVTVDGALTGLATDFDGEVVALTGTASVNASGTVSFGGAWLADFTNDEFAMDSGKTVIIGTAVVDGDGRDILVVVDAPAFDKRLAFGNPASNQAQQSFLRVTNRSNATGTVTLSAIDDTGATAPGGNISFTLGPFESKNFNSLDYETGNAGKGISGAFGDGSGKWQFLVSSFLDLEVMSLIRTPDGFLTNLTDIVPVRASGVYEIYFGNPGSNQSQQSFLRIVNKSDATGQVTLSGIDDAGNPAPGGNITFTMGPNEARNLNSLDYENGNPGKGLSGALGDGAGKWHLTLTSALPLEVMSLIRSSDGFVTNLSGQVPSDDESGHRIDFANPGTNLDQQTFLRIVNESDAAGTVTVSGIDDAGSIAPGGNVQFDLGPLESKNINAIDLENGNGDKGLVGALGDGSGRWQLTITSELQLQVMSLIRTLDGFVTNLSRVTPQSNWETHEGYFFNPGSNNAQKSLLRLVNRTDTPADVLIIGTDDSGNMPGSSVSLTLAPNTAKEITAEEIESGGLDLSGSLGDGVGKWHLTVSSQSDIAVMSLMETPGGFLTNQSRVIP